jgi:ribonuclease HI
MGDEQLYIFTDGSCDPNPGPGGWAALLEWRSEGELINSVLHSGGQYKTTNNLMELQAAIEGLQHAGLYKSKIHITTDSEYVRQGITSWIKNWKKNGWRTAKGKPVANQESWKELDRLRGLVNVEWHWTKAHAGHPQNTTVDLEARQQARIFKEENKKRPRKTDNCHQKRQRT